MMEIDRIEGNRIFLRQMRADDTKDILRWRNNPSVVRRFIYRETVTEEDHLKWIREKVDTGLVKQFIITVRETGRGIGSVYLQKIDMDNKTAEFGIFIGEDDENGKGYGTEALQLITNYAFEKLGLVRLTLRVLEDNKSARSVYEKNGWIMVPDDCGSIMSDGREVRILDMEKTNG
ncbi:MAG: GNAT family N-acetyltransferase [Lachnospiraceae bacterium]|nr:GNAT family N-acetyltransferase [Lachnospiraceae bacterium]